MIHRSSRPTLATTARWHGYCRSRCPEPPPCAPPSAGDADAVAALLRARERRDLGPEETTADDVRAEWAVPGLDRADARRVGRRRRARRPRGLRGRRRRTTCVVAVHPGAVGPRPRHARCARRRSAGARTRHARGATVHPRHEHRGPDPPARRGLVAGAPLLPDAHRSQGRPTQARRRSRGPSTPTATPRRSGTWSRAPTPTSRASCRSRSRLARDAAGKPGWDPALWLLQHDARGHRRRRAGRARRQGRGAHRARHDASPSPSARAAAATAAAASSCCSTRSAARGSATPRPPRTGRPRPRRACSSPPACRSRGRRERWEKVLGV